MEKTPIILDPDRVDQFIELAGSGLQPVLWKVAVVLALTGLTIYFWRRAHRRHVQQVQSGQKQTADRLWEKKVHSLDLAPGQVAVLEAMVDSAGLGDSERHYLFHRPSVFYKAQNRLLDSGHNLGREAIGLQVRLGMKGRHKIKTTADLRESMEVQVQRSRGDAHRFWTEVHQTQESGLWLKSEVDLTAFTNRRLLFLLPLQGGLYSFESWILQSEAGRMLIAHSMLVLRKEERKSFRKQVQLRAYLDGAAGQLVDLGGGGACIDSAAFRPDGGHIARFVFTLPSGRRVDCSVKVSPGTKPGRYHLAFEDIRESDRDAIYKFLFRVQ